MDLETLRRDYEKCGGYLRRIDATVKNPSPLYDVTDVLGFALNQWRTMKEKPKPRERVLVQRNKFISLYEYRRVSHPPFEYGWVGDSGWFPANESDFWQPLPAPTQDTHGQSKTPAL